MQANTVLAAEKVEGGLSMCLNNTEHRVKNKLASWFDRKRIDRVEPVDSSGRCWRARLMDGGLAYATVEEDGSITIEEREVVC